MLTGGVFLPPNAGARSETLGAVTASSAGTVVTASGSANTKGSYTDIGSTTSFSYELLWVLFHKNSVAADYTVDLAINTGGNRAIFAEDLQFPGAIKFIGEGNGHWQLPIHIPSGAQLSARCQCTTGSATLECVIIGFSNGIGGMPGFSRCRALYTPSSSRGVAVDPGGTANVESAWVQLVASSGFIAHALMPGIGFNNDIARTNNGKMAVDFAIGAAGVEQAFLNDIGVGYGATSDGPMTSGFPVLPFYVPASTRISTRARNSDNVAGDRTIDVSLWGFEL